MLYLKAKLIKVNTGDRNYLVLSGSYYSKMLESDVPTPVSVLVDTNDVSKLSDLQSKLGTVVEVPVKPVYSSKKGRIFYITNY